MLIEQPPTFFRRLFPAAIFRMPEKAYDGRTVYLTFDDGPVPEATPFVLDTLEHYDVKATFFMVGDNARRYPYLLDAVRSRGHCIGNHTMNHLQGHRTPDRVYYRNILEANSLLGATLFRPPHGWMRPRQARLIDKRFGIVMFDVVTRDYSKRMTPEQVLGNVKKYSRPGSIIVFHDSQRGERNLKGSLARSIEWLKMQGYRFDVLSNLKHAEK